MIRLLFAALVALMALPLAVTANPNCAPREMVIERLASTYGETRQSIGVGHQGVVIETFASLDTGTWTITVTTPNGITCLVASGVAWERLAEGPPVAGDPT